MSTENDLKMLDQYQIDCPNCGTLLRNIRDKKKRLSCPDCGAKDAIFLPYRRFTYEALASGEILRVKEKKAL